VDVEGVHAGINSVGCRGDCWVACCTVSSLSSLCPPLLPAAPINFSNRDVAVKVLAAYTHIMDSYSRSSMVPSDVPQSMLPSFGLQFFLMCGQGISFVFAKRVGTNTDTDTRFPLAVAAGAASGTDAGTGTRERTDVSRVGVHLILRVPNRYSIRPFVDPIAAARGYASVVQRTGVGSTTVSSRTDALGPDLPASACNSFGSSFYAAWGEGSVVAILIDKQTADYEWVIPKVKPSFESIVGSSAVGDVISIEDMVITSITTNSEKDYDATEKKIYCHEISTVGFASSKCLLHVNLS
jgi:hypothetical protein